MKNGTCEEYVRLNSMSICVYPAPDHAIVRHSSLVAHTLSAPQLIAVLVVSHARVKLKMLFGPHHIKCIVGLFRDTIVGVEAICELLAVLVGSVVGQHLLACGALEGLEASLALDGLRGGVLVTRLVQFVLRDYSH